MSPAARLAAFALALAAAFGVGAAAGSAVGPIEVRERPNVPHHEQMDVEP